MIEGLIHRKYRQWEPSLNRVIIRAINDRVIVRGYSIINIRISFPKKFLKSDSSQTETEECLDAWDLVLFSGVTSSKKVGGYNNFSGEQ